MDRTPEEEARLEWISNEAAKIAKQKYILPMTRVLLIVVAGILLALGIILLVLNTNGGLIVSIVSLVIAVVLLILRFTVFRKKRN